MLYRHIDQCRSCGHRPLTPILDLGPTPLADRLLTASELDSPDVLCPLDLCFCPNCGLIQILQTVEPSTLFDDRYPYLSSVSETLLSHSARNAEELISDRGLGARSLVLEIASNDGYMLRHFARKDIPVLGIDPALTAVTAARDLGIPTRLAFFDLSLARELRQEGTVADLVIANNVLAHVADLNGFVEGIATVLHPLGLAVLEVPYVVDMVEHCEFDTVYHQHLCYFSVTALQSLFRRHGLHINLVRRLTIHGGSIRLYVGHRAGKHPTVDDLLHHEKQAGYADLAVYEAFARRTREIRKALRGLLSGLKAYGHSICAYGAAAKGTTLLSFCGIDHTMLDYVVDRNPVKHGCYMPGSRLPICRVERLREDMPPYTLLLAWNFAEEISQQQADYLRGGGQFITPIPWPSVL